MDTTDKERIEILIKHLKTNKNALGLAIGEINGSKFNHIVKGRNGISEKLAVKITNTFSSINYEWLVYGTGNMLKTLKNDDENTSVKEDLIKTANGDFVDIDTIINIIELNQEKFDVNPRYLKTLEKFKSLAIIEYQEKLLLKYQKENK